MFNKLQNRVPSLQLLAQMKNKNSERCRPGSIEQQTDMCEEGDLRGDQITHEYHSKPKLIIDEGDNFNEDMSTEDREGDDLSGDDHSSGLQGGEEEVRHQPHIETGMPGDREEKQDEEFDRSNKVS
jgi:hypothetical protein